MRTAGKGANLLLNVGPQPNGELPAVAVERLREMGQWLARFGESIYGTTGGASDENIVETQKGKTLYKHILGQGITELSLPASTRISSAICLNNGANLPIRKMGKNLVIACPQLEGTPDIIIKLERR